MRPYNTRITIGRNIGTIPMYERAWLDFQQTICHLFDTIHDEQESAGEWDGVPEDNFTVSGITHRATPNRLAAIARAYGQDAIAVLHGHSLHWRLVYADGTTARGWES